MVHEMNRTVDRIYNRIFFLDGHNILCIIPPGRKTIRARSTKKVCRILQKKLKCAGNIYCRLVRIRQILLYSMHGTEQIGIKSTHA